MQQRKLTQNMTRLSEKRNKIIFFVKCAPQIINQYPNEPQQANEHIRINLKYVDVMSAVIADPHTLMLKTQYYQKLKVPI